MMLGAALSHYNSLLVAVKGEFSRRINCVHTAVSYGRSGAENKMYWNFSNKIIVNINEFSSGTEFHRRADFCL
jgi:hypothetical protein